MPKPIHELDTALDQALEIASVSPRATAVMWTDGDRWWVLPDLDADAPLDDGVAGTEVSSTFLEGPRRATARALLRAMARTVAGLNLRGLVRATIDQSEPRTRYEFPPLEPLTVGPAEG